VSSEALARFYIRGLRTGAGMMMGHGQYTGMSLPEVLASERRGNNLKRVWTVTLELRPDSGLVSVPC
jgi:hypothetical protein